MVSLPESVEGFLSHGGLLRILTFTHLEAGNSGSPWLEEEEKISMCVQGGKVWWQPSVGQVL